MKSLETNMPEGPRNIFLEALVKDGHFSRVEAAALLGEWTEVLRPHLIGLAGDIARQVRRSVDAGQPITSDRVLHWLRRARAGVR